MANVPLVTLSCPRAVFRRSRPELRAMWTKRRSVSPACLLHEPMIWLKLSVSNTFLAEEVTEKGLIQSVQMHWIAIGRDQRRKPIPVHVNYCLKGRVTGTVCLEHC
jgi:hypothetical protein